MLETPKRVATMHQQCHLSQRQVTSWQVICLVREHPLPPPPLLGLGLAWGSASPLRRLLRGMPASIKTKVGLRRNREGSSTGKRLDLTPEEKDEFGSYHSHYHFIDDTLDTASPRQLNQPSTKNITGDVGTTDRATLFVPKAVVFSSKAASDLQSLSSAVETPLTQSCIAHGQSKVQNEQQNTGARKKSLGLSKLTQTSSSISEKMVACRSIAVGVTSDIDHFQEKCGKDQSRPASRSTGTWWNASIASRRTQPPGSCLTISSGRYSRTESSIMAALEAPLASHRHARCMAENSSFSSKTTKSLPTTKKTKNAPNPAAKETGKRKQRNRAKSRVPHS